MDYFIGVLICCFVYSWGDYFIMYSSVFGGICKYKIRCIVERDFEVKEWNCCLVKNINILWIGLN